MSGKKGSFTDAENRVLREALKRYRAEKELTQGAMGELLGIKQQNVARAEHGGGMNRSTANALARLLGMRDAEEYLLSRGVLAEMELPPPARADGPAGPGTGASWRMRDMAMRMSAGIGYDPVAVQAVAARYTDEESRHRPLKWWFRKFDEEERERREAEPIIPPAPKSTPITQPSAAVMARRRRVAR